jgi:metal-responsive CopG/Arc/MetJ family transcriptional regulator
MRKTIYLPDELAAEVDAYLKRHHGATFSSLVQQALQEKVGMSKRRSILDLAGLVSVEPDDTDKEFADRPEDRFATWYDGPPGR